MEPLKKEKARTSLDISCLKWAYIMNLKSPHIMYTVEFLLLRFRFKMEDPDIVSDAMNIFF